MMSTTAAKLWHGNYRSTVYPVDLDASPAYGTYRKEEIKSLVQLCAAFIVQDSGMTKQALDIIPKHLYEPFLQEALVKNRELAIQEIIASWPLPSLILHRLMPNLFTSVQALFNSSYQCDIVKQGLRYTTALAQTFLDSLKKGSTPRLQYLDLTGFPTAEVIVYFVATHCMLAHNEVRHETILSMYNQAVKHSGQALGITERMEPIEHSLPPDCSVIIKLDAFVMSEATHTELCKALKVSSFRDRKLCLIVSRLGMTCLGVCRVGLLLKLVDPQHLTGLQLQYNALNSGDFVEIASALKGLVCLESLDLSCNSIFFHQHEEACKAAAEVFAAMPKLKRLDLSNNRIKTRLRRLLEAVVQPLTSLRLAGCGLTVTDLLYLSHSHHSSYLEALDLSENNLKLCERQVRGILSATQSCLQLLELEHCSLNDQMVQSLTYHFSGLRSLKYLNVAENQLSHPCLASLTAAVAELVSLQVFKTSFPTDCYQHENEEDEERGKEDVIKEIALVFSNSGVNSLRAKPVHLAVIELDRVWNLA